MYVPEAMAKVFPSSLCRGREGFRKPGSIYTRMAVELFLRIRPLTVAIHAIRCDKRKMVRMDV